MESEKVDADGLVLLLKPHQRVSSLDGSHPPHTNHDENDDKNADVKETADEGDSSDDDDGLAGGGTVGQLQWSRWTIIRQSVCSIWLYT